MKKDIILFIVIFTVLLFVGGGTYAYWSWVSDERKEAGFVTSSSLEQYIRYDAGESHFVGNFQPSDSYCNDSIYNTIKIGKTSAAKEMMLVSSIKLDVNSIGSNISSSDNVYWVVISGESSTCSSRKIASGTFKGVKKGDVLTLTTNRFVYTEDVVETYTIYIWIDSSGSNASLSGETLDVNVWTKIDQVAAWYGDLDFDALYTTNDTFLISNHLSGKSLLTGQALKNADVNIDGIVDETDATLIRKAVAGSIVLGSGPYIG